MKPEKFSLLVNDITEYLFAAAQNSETKRMFVVMIMTIIFSIDDGKQDKAIRFLTGVDSWNEGLLNMFCSHKLFRDSFRELIESDETKKASQVKTSIDKQ